MVDGIDEIVDAIQSIAEDIDFLFDIIEEFDSLLDEFLSSKKSKKLEELREKYMEDDE